LRASVLLWDRGFLGSVAATENKGSYVVHRIKLSAPSGKCVLLPLIPIWWIIEALWIVKLKPKIIHAGDLISVIPALFVGALLRSKVVYDIFDFYSQMRFSDSKSSRWSFIFSLVGWVEKLAIRLSDVVILPHEQQSFLLESVCPKLHTTYVYHSPENIEFIKSDNGAAKDSKIAVLYSGYLEESRGVDHLIKAIDGLDSVILFITGFGKKAHLIETISNNMKNLVYLGFVSRSKMLELMRDTNAFVVTYDPTVPVCKVASPSKLYEAMMFGKPVIVSKGTVAESIVQQEKCGLCVEYGNIQELRNSLVLLGKDKRLRQTLGNNARAAYENKYNWNNSKKRLIYAYKQLIERL
jgi:glycosyltransferase involved in cell wall biosynthesis